MTKQTTRRTFVAQSSSLAAGVAVAPNFTCHVPGSDEIKIAVIGCGGRGTGAALQILGSDKANARLIAVADAFPDKAAGRINRLRKQHGEKVDVPRDRIFGGLDGFKKAIDCGADLVIIATPPGFKPQQFEYAVARGKHIFMEKPVASCAEGVRRVLAANEIAKSKNLMVGIGLQRRHQANYMDCVRRLQDGAIGDINMLRVYWNGAGIWYRPREESMTEMQFQVHNWYHFIWASGDQICEQHIHNLDVGCWVKGMYPVEANGMGGRERRLEGDRTKSQIFDHTFVEYTFPDGSKMYSQGRHLRNSFTQVAEFAHGSKGVSKVGGWIDPTGGKRIKMPRIKVGGHQQEQHDLLEALSKGEIYNEGDYGAKSTFTAILGREACYHGKSIKWDKLMNQGKNLSPGIDEFGFDSNPPAMPNAQGEYPVPLPGVYSPYA